MQAWKKQEEEEGLAQNSSLYVPALKHICKGKYAGMKERRKEGKRERERGGEREEGGDILALNPTYGRRIGDLSLLIQIHLQKRRVVKNPQQCVLYFGGGVGYYPLLINTL
jgi:hypothetical protein